MDVVLVFQQWNVVPADLPLGDGTPALVADHASDAPTVAWTRRFRAGADPPGRAAHERQRLRRLPRITAQAERRQRTTILRL